MIRKGKGEWFRVKRWMAGILAVCFMVCSLNIQETVYGQTKGENRIEQISLGAMHSGAVTSDGSLYMWGDNRFGQLGDGSATNRSKPVKVLENVASVSLGSDHSGAITQDGSLYMWGYNQYGELGEGSTTRRSKPVKVLENVASVSLGSSHSGAITQDGSLYMWGHNGNGELGDGSATNRSKPVKVLENVASVSLGSGHSSAITQDGSLYMWGYNLFGELGEGSTTRRSKPVKVLENVASVSLGGIHSGAITQDGSLYMWGHNGYGELGDGSTTNRSEPVKVLENVVSVSLGSSYGGAITQDGSLYMWGYNWSGKVGDGSTTNRSKPVKVLENVASVSLGGYSSAITQDGSLYMWGNNEHGQFGDGTTTNSLVPKKIDLFQASHIVSVFPKSGYSYMNLGTLECSIKFDQNIEKLEKTASLVEYDTNKVVDTINLNSVEPMGDELKLLFNDNYSANGTKLTANTKYYIRLDENAVKLEDGTMAEGITDRDFWTLQTVPIEHSLIKNGDTNKEIEWNIYKMLFPHPITALWIKNSRPNGTGGLCFGFAYATGAWKNGYTGIKAIGKNHSLMDVSLDTKGNLNHTYMEYLQLAQIYQYTDFMQTMLKVSENRYDNFYEALTRFQNGNGPTIILCVNNHKNKGHAIVPLGIISEDDNSVVIACYDCNGDLSVGEYNQGGRFMNNFILKKSDGKFVDWSYREYNNLDNKKGYFRFCTVNEWLDLDKIMVNESDYVKESPNLIHSQQELNGLDEIISYGSATDSNTDRHLYWTEENSISRSAIDSTNISEIGITDGLHEISVSAPLNSDITLDLNTNTLQAAFNGESEYTAVHTSAEDDKINSISIKGIASGSISTVKTEEGVILKADNITGVTAAIENDTASGEVIFSTEKDSVLIKENDNNIVISEDGNGNGNGVYDTVISTAPITEKEHTWDSGKVTKKATCTKKGIKTYTCITCGETKTEDIAMNDHKYKSVTVAATTSKNGSITKKCTVCGKKKSHTIIYRIKSVSLKSKSYTYNGKSKKPSATVKDAKGNKIKSNYYTISYKKNKGVGEATATVSFKGKYTGKLTKKFKILPKGTSISGELTSKPKQFTVKWKKQPKSTTGYQVQYSTSKKFTKKTTVTKTIKKVSTTKLTVKNLKAKKKYYVRIRTYKTVKGKKYYSGWSSVKSVTTKVMKKN